MVDFILKAWIWITLINNKEKLPTESKIINPKIEYEAMSGSIIWEDEGLWELRNRHLQNAFKYVLNHRMQLIVGQSNDVGIMRSKNFDKNIFEMAKKHFPNWIGFDKSRCIFNSELRDKINRIKNIENWKFEKKLSN